jgi:hypothetical protein
VGTACHYGAHHPSLTAWLRARSPGTPTAASCHSYECRDRRAQVLLAHPPVGCDAATVTAWDALRAECGSIGGVCCSNCTLERTSFCDVGLPARNRYPVTAYAGVATFVAVLALTWVGKPPPRASASFAPAPRPTAWTAML